MSVWKKVKSNALGRNVDERILDSALASMGLGLDKTVKSIRNGFGSDTCDAALINKDGKVTSVGIVYNKDRGIELVGDPWGTGLGKDGGHQGILDSIAQSYQVEHIKAKAVENMWTVESIKTNAEGEIEVELSSMF